MARQRRAKGEAVPAPTPSAHAPGLRLAAAAALVALAIAGLLLAKRSAGPPSLLLVTIDTLRADHVSAYGYPQPTTPSLDGLARRGVRFASAQSASPLTGPSHATLLTGHYPPVHGVRDNARFVIGDRTPTLAERLQRAGYDTAAFVSAFPVAAAFGFGRGFDVFDEGLHAARAGQLAERPANEAADAAAAWLRGRGARPFFAWVHFYDPHEPYAPPAAERARFPHPLRRRDRLRRRAGRPPPRRPARSRPRAAHARGGPVRPRRGSRRARRIDPRPAALRVDAARPVRARRPRRAGGTRGERAGRHDRRAADAARAARPARLPRACPAATSDRRSRADRCRASRSTPRASTGGSTAAGRRCAA